MINKALNNHIKK